MIKISEKLKIALYLYYFMKKYFPDHLYDIEMIEEVEAELFMREEYASSIQDYAMQYADECIRIEGLPDEDLYLEAAAACKDSFAAMKLLATKDEDELHTILESVIDYLRK